MTRSSYENLPKYGPGIPVPVPVSFTNLVERKMVPDGRFAPDRPGSAETVTRALYDAAIYRLTLSTHFTLREFLRSDTALEHDIDNTPETFAVLLNLRMLAACMEQVRAALGNQIVRITSGYRCERLNDLVGGAAQSHHRTGVAADFTADGFGTPTAIYRRLTSERPEPALEEARRRIARICLEPSWVHLVARNPVPDAAADPPHAWIDPRAATRIANADASAATPAGVSALLDAGGRPGVLPRQVVPESRALDALERLGLSPQPTLFSGPRYRRSDYAVGSAAASAAPIGAAVLADPHAFAVA